MSVKFKVGDRVRLRSPHKLMGTISRVADRYISVLWDEAENPMTYLDSELELIND